MTIAQDPTINYEDLGYNNRLQATDSLAAKNEQFINAYTFDTQTDRNAVTNYNIRTISADKISAGIVNSNVIYTGTINLNQLYGGTAILGGTTNGNGLISVNNSSGNEVVKLDNTGITVKDTSGTTFIDGSGIVSNNVFLNNSISGSPNTAFTNTSYQIITGTGTISLTLARSVKALILLSIVASSGQINSSNDCNGRVHYDVFSNVDSELMTFFYDCFLTQSSNVRENIISKTYFSSKVVTLNSGNHNINLRSTLEFNNNLTSTVNNYSLIVLLLGS